MKQLDFFQPVSTLSNYPRVKEIPMPKLPQVTQAAINQALKLLSASGCKYKVIDPTGVEYGDLEVVQQRKKRKGDLEFGAYSNHYKPYIENLAVGDVAVIPIDKFQYVKLLGSLSAWCTKSWGKGNTKTCKAGNTIQVLRCG